VTLVITDTLIVVFTHLLTVHEQICDYRMKHKVAWMFIAKRCSLDYTVLSESLHSFFKLYAFAFYNLHKNGSCAYICCR